MATQHQSPMHTSVLADLLSKSCDLQTDANIDLMIYGIIVPDHLHIEINTLLQFTFTCLLYRLHHYIDYKEIVAQVGYILCEFISTKQGNITKYFKIQYLNPHPINYWLHRSKSMNWRFIKVPEFSFSLTACPPYRNSNTTLKNKQICFT